MFEQNTDRKLCIICSKGTLDMAYPGLILANAALMEGIDVTLFFTFWGLDIIHKKRMNELKFVAMGNPSTGIPNFVGGLPGMTNMATNMMKKQMVELDVPDVDEFIDMLSDAGAQMYACQMTVDMMHYTKEDFHDGVDSIVGAMEMLEMADGAQVIFV